MATLYDLTDELMRLKHILESEEYPEETIEAATQAYFEETTAEKIEAYCKLIKSLDVQAEAHKAEAQSQTAKRFSAENQVERLKNRLQWYMETTDQKELAAGTFKVRLQANGGKAPLVFIDGFEPGMLPEEFRRVKVEPDSDKIREALEQGENLGFVAIGERGQGVRIR